MKELCLSALSALKLELPLAQAQHRLSSTTVNIIQGNNIWSLLYLLLYIATENIILCKCGNFTDLVQSLVNRDLHTMSLDSYS